MKLKLRLIATLLISTTLCLSLFSCASKFDISDESDESNESYLDSGTNTNSQNSGNSANNNNSNGNSTNKGDSNSNNKDTNDKDNEDSGNSSNSGSSETSSTEIDKSFASNAFPLFLDGSYLFDAIMPDKPTDAEYTVYAKLRSEMKKATGKTLQTNTDYLKEGDKHSTSAPEILVGLTNYTESINVYENMENESYGIKIVGKKIVFYFSRVDEGLKLVSSFISAMTNQNKEKIWIKKTYSLSSTSRLTSSPIPKYTDSTTSYNCYDDTTMLLAKKSSLTNYKSYCENLVSKEGFTEYSKRDNVNGNYFRTYTKGNMALTVYYNKSDTSVRIISGPITDIPQKDTSSAKETNKTPSISLLYQGLKPNGVTQWGSGLGMVFHLPNGKFIIYDGGYTANDGLYKKLKELAGSNDIIIAAWIISHPHGDHEEAFDKFLSTHADEVRIESIMYNYTQFKDDYGDTETIKGYVNKYLDGKTMIVKPHTGQIYSFGTSTVEILHTVEDYMPSIVKDPNNASMVVRITVSGKSTLLLGDAHQGTTDKFLINTYGSHLKSDMVQLSHHGTDPGSADLYNNIKAQVIFWPSSKDNVQDKYKSGSSSYSGLTKAFSLASDVYLASEGPITITLPYTIKNNKSSFLTRMGVK